MKWLMRLAVAKKVYDWWKSRNRPKSDKSYPDGYWK